MVSGFFEEGKDNLDYIIVLGAQVRESGPSVVLKYRLDRAIDYLEENPDTKCIVSGGQGKNEPFAEAVGMADYLQKNGIDGKRIIVEAESRTTEENIKNSKTFLEEDASLGIITNDFHVFRALQMAGEQGLSEACGIAADSSKLYLPNNMLREFFAEIKHLVKLAGTALLENALLLELHCKVKTRLTADTGNNRIGTLGAKNSRHVLKGKRLHVNLVRNRRIGHNCRRIGVYENNLVALLTKCKTSLRARIVKLRRLTDNDRTGADDHNFFDVCSL